MHFFLSLNQIDYYEYYFFILASPFDQQIYISNSGVQATVTTFKLATQTPGEMLFTSRAWFQPNQRLTFTARSSKVLFEEATKRLKLSESNCGLNTLEFDARLGIFISGTIQPSQLDAVELTLTNQNGEVLEKALVSDKFRLGPLKAPYSQYDVTLVKSGYLFTHQSAGTKADTVHYEFIAEKLGQLRVSVLETKTGLKLDSVLLSLSSENRQFRQNFKTDALGEALFENLKPGLYYLIVMMQEYEFTPNSHPVRVADGEQTSLQVGAVRTAYSCVGKVSSINGQAENGAQVEAVGVYRAADGDAEGCAQSQESGTVENGVYRVFNLKPRCEYVLRVGQAKGQVRIVPESYGFVVGETDVVDRDFVVLDSGDKVDFSLGVSFKALDSPMFASMHYFVKVRRFCIR